MVGYSQHKADNQRFMTIVVLEVFNNSVKLSFFVLRDKQIFILKLPSERTQLKSLVFPEDVKFFKPLQT